MKHLLLVSLAVVYALLSVTAAQAHPASPPNHDVYVDVNTPDENFNGNFLEASASTASCEPTTLTFLQWDLSHIPAYAAVPTATLTLTTTFVTNVEATQVALYATGDAWTEDTLTYATAPTLGTKLDSQPAPAAGAALTFSSEALRLYLEEQLAENRIASFALLLEGTCSWGVTLVLFNDREQGVDVPDLYLETVTRPVDLAIHKTGPAFAAPGQTITYTLFYTNVGNIPVNYAIITDTLPAEVHVYDYTDSIILPLPGNLLMWERFDLAPGDSGALTITAIVNPAFTGLLTNTATITTTTAVESDPTNNTAAPVVTVVQAPDLAIHKSGPATAHPGDIIEYTLAYTNTGDAPAAYVAITDLLPLHTQLYGHSGTVLLPMPDNALTWELFNLAPGASGTFTVTVTIDPTYTGWITNTATLSTTTPEVVLDNNVDTAATQVIAMPVVWHYLYLPLVMRASP
jgi:uncharacterized repeat protein (TIGR01451 family)